MIRNLPDMTTNEILHKTEHRPWKIPDKPWKFYQEWNDAVFLHWQVDFDELSKLVHPDLEIDLFEGKPWISLVGFNMERIRPKNLPAFPPISNFAEINIRTYVKYKGKSGVHFLSIEGAKRLSCTVSRNISELPYRYSKMRRAKDRFESRNDQFNDSFNIGYSIGKKLTTKREVDRWLTERYALFQDTPKNINAFEIHHIEWPTYELKISDIEVSYPRFDQLINRSPDIVHYSPGVQVIAWGKKKNKII